MSELNNINVDILDNLIIGRVEPQIYAFTTQTIPNYLKVGDTYRPLEKRLNEWRKYFPNLEKKFENLAKVDDETFFRDYAVHFFLENDLKRKRLGRDVFENIPYYSNEFFENATEQDLQKAIKDIENGHKNNDPKYQYYRFEESHIPLVHTYLRTEEYNPRPNQQETINKFREAINKGRTNLLMYAVMRFGKSFTSMCCAVEMGAKSVVVVSAKADVKEEWKKTVESHIKFDGYSFLDSNSLLQSDSVITEKRNANEKFILFLTLQDLQGDEIKAKHKALFENNIDLLLIDETHFGARAEEYGKVLKEEKLSAKELRSELKLNDNTLDDLEITNKVFNSKIRIHLSGTPYRILMNSEFTDDDIIAFYQFTNIAEDQEKWDLENLNKDEVKEWDNPYYGFPQMVRFAFNPNESSRKKMEQLKKNGITYAFSELFKPQSITKDNQNGLHKKFVHETEILDLLKIIDGSETDDNLLSFLDYDKIKEGKMCRHIVCVLPYRASSDALEELIKNHDFKHLSNYEIINISGVENDDYKDTRGSSGTQKVIDKIKKCESENIKTITLTVNRMLTGSTVPEWDTMLYLKDTSSPQEYDQAVFRLQNQYIKVYKEQNGDVVKFNMKPQTLLVDFNPNRMFQMQEHKSQIYNVNTDKNGNSLLAERIKRELEISPIIVLNNNKMVEIQPTDILDAVRRYSNSRSVLDEATTISIDYSLLDIEAIKAEIERQNKINSRNGIDIKPTEGEGENLEFPNTPTKESDDDDKNKEPNKTKDEETVNDYKGQFAMYYARILFFAFLTDSRVKSLQEIINEIEKNEDNQKICNNLNLDKQILSLFQEHINPFILSELDYKIQNINSLANDTSISPIERASNAMKKFSRLSDSEIVTPETVTDMMINSLPENTINNNIKMLDIASKQGEFVYAVYKKFGKDVANNFYSVPTSNIAYEFTRKVYKLLELDVNLIEANYTSYDLISENNYIENETITINSKKMKFNVIVGNPPYQQSDGGAQASAKPIYNLFVDVAKMLNPNNIVIIMPTRWYAGGKGLDEFRDQMLNDSHISELHDFLNPDILFQNTNNRGGICFFVRDKSYNNTKNLTKVFTYKNNLTPVLHKRSLKTPDSDILIRHSIALEIISKIKSHTDFKTFENHISSRKPFDLEGNVVKDTSIFRPNIKRLKNPITCFGRGKQIGYLERSEITKNEKWIDNFKVFAPYANNIGTELNDDNLNAFVGIPKTICTETYIIMGADLKLNEVSANNLVKYFYTKFARFMHSLPKVSQHGTSKTYRFVPVQNFTESSDIDWSKSIIEIDKQLYAKYNLSKEEIEFIESMIKSMSS
ncbi:Eco57I restriction-modification methylase domain-containing protein [Elizabethkingia sp. M8]|uniref:Eco57I restriction-modification methylase domain-containing protein n=1 Tax=Elizabethkingia sp. M8 TaxID=2796140 RepID=UPI0019058398|nr:Eco57I restriction-modification methylase domain-containing protein [Elizabethkingia sp. M8]QQM28510.1 Eco57I restriction-modification methylase domain-containing protein [Elizabethkingia sp. M8]